MGHIKAVLVGVGAMNAITARLLLERGVEIVGAVGRSATKIGRDAGDVLQLETRLGVEVTADAAELYERTRPDIALIATTSFMRDVFDVLATCARSKVNAITIAEELLYPRVTAPEQTRQLDDIARVNGITLAGGGFQDYFLVNQVAGLLGTTHRFSRLVGSENFNVDDYGPEVARDQRVGDTIEDFSNWLDSGSRPPSFALPILGAIADASGLTVAETRVELHPDIAQMPTESTSLNTVIPAGRLIGFTMVDTVLTAEGPTLQMAISGHIYSSVETDHCEWRVYGDPDLTVTNPGVNTLRTTCTQMVNRIPDVINAPPGFVTPTTLPPLRYRPLPLAEYLMS